MGLGNPGKEYIDTRHNVGFMFLDYLSEKFDIKTTDIAKEYMVTSFSDIDINLFRPQLFMNNSGGALYEYWKYKNYKEKELLIVHDDLDLKLGEFKIQKGKAPKQHKGVKSLESNIDLKESYRLRIGIENRQDKAMPGSSYVLKRFESEELIILKQTFDEIWKSFETKEK